MSGLHLVVFAILLAGPTEWQESGAPKREPPQLLKSTLPRYPPDAFRRRTQGTVLLSVAIDENGKVQSATVLKSIPGLDDAAIETVKKWQFKAALTDGKPVATRAEIPVAFRIFETNSSAPRRIKR